MNVEPSVCLEEKLFYNRNHIDLGRSHIGLRAHNAVAAAASLVKAGPARCFEPKAKCDVEITLEGCIECDTHRVVGELSGDMKWSYQCHG